MSLELLAMWYNFGNLKKKCFFFHSQALKKSYVDVFNPSGAAPSRPAESIMAPPVPTMPTPQAGFFVPGPAPAGGAQSNDTAAEVSECLL